MVYAKPAGTSVSGTMQRDPIKVVSKDPLLTEALFIDWHASTSPQLDSTSWCIGVMIVKKADALLDVWRLVPRIRAAKIDVTKFIA